MKANTSSNESPTETAPPGSARRSERNSGRAVSFCEEEADDGEAVLPTTCTSVEHHQKQRLALQHRSSSLVTENSYRSPGPCTCLTWSRHRIQVAALGCCSALMVVTIRLILDFSSGSTYIIHSIIILLDMALIHLFTNSPWLSFGGECVTVMCFLGYHFTHETIFELVETTFIAVLCSLHMILSRDKHMNHEEQLEESLREWHKLSMRSNFGSASSSVTESQGSDGRGWRPLLLEVDEEQGNTATAQNSPKEAASENPDIGGLPQDQTQKVVLVKEDESIQNHQGNCKGVMYTSFLGLILDELINYGINRADDDPCT
ncbi:expressed unknown protein [Seminavis robusta]|uniref:Uncharacterized protein n=1 Tax=Seminavis robusta TaxID=568900 RepID=A0A9N8EVY5_9STRA|nr:expressed unknown protein [Seminavis robusta]|eukprot:Sro2180_g317940.1 n/a (318) ;mRNA; f:877-1924